MALTSSRAELASQTKASSFVVGDASSFASGEGDNARQRRVEGRRRTSPAKGEHSPWQAAALLYRDIGCNASDNGKKHSEKFFGLSIPKGLLAVFLPAKGGLPGSSSASDNIVGAAGVL